MQIQKCLASLEEYYGEFPRDVIRKIVEKYLENFNEKELDILYQRVLLEVSCNRNTIPDIATLEKVKRMINKERADARHEPIGQDFTRLRRSRKYCPKSECGGEILGGVCMRCGWSKSRPGKIE